MRLYYVGLFTLLRYESQRVSHTLLYFEDGPESNETVSEGIAVMNSTGVRRRVAVDGATASSTKLSSSGGNRNSGTTAARRGIIMIVMTAATPTCNKTKNHGWLQCFSLQK